MYRQVPLPCFVVNRSTYQYFFLFKGVIKGTPFIATPTTLSKLSCGDDGKVFIKLYGVLIIQVAGFGNQRPLNDCEIILSNSPLVVRARIVLFLLVC